MKKFTLLLTAFLMLAFSMVAQIKLVVYKSDGTEIELLAGDVDSIGFKGITVDTDDDDNNDNNDGPIHNVVLPEVSAPGEGYTTIVLYIPESECDEAEPYILGVLDGYDRWSNEPDRAMESLGNGWWQVTVEALTPENATNFKFRMDDGENGAGGWTYEPKGSYQLLRNASEYLVVKDDEQNNLLAISNCDNKVLYIMSGKWSNTPCRAPIPAGNAKFILTVTGNLPDDAEVIFTGNFGPENNEWGASERVMTKQDDGTYVWEGEYPENFRFKAFLSNYYYDSYYDVFDSWLTNDIYVELGAGSVIRFEGCFSGFCPGDEVDDDDTEVVISTPSGYHNSYGYVDLGLPSGTLWATMNVGAESPEDYGDYFAWGETESKEEFNWSTYKWMTDGMSSWDAVNRYTFDDGQIEAVWYDEYGNFIGDNMPVLYMEDDVAHAQWGGNWSMPTKVQQDELRTECTWTWSIHRGIYGYKVTGRNDNSIFLPAAGTRIDSGFGTAGVYGCYWSCSLTTNYSDYAYELEFGSDNNIGRGDSPRYSGLSVRAVFR